MIAASTAAYGVEHGSLRVMAGVGPPSTVCSADLGKVVDGVPAQAMTVPPDQAPNHAALADAATADVISADVPSTDVISADDAEDEPETGPLRRCIVTRERHPKERMIRFVIGPDRALVPDLAARLPGRGIWLSASGDVLQHAGAQGDAYRQLVRAFARAARGQVSVPPNLSDMLEAALLRRIGEFLGLARRAGQAIAGFEKAREWVRGGQASVAVQASDGSEAERTRFLSGAAASISVIDPLPAEALGRIFAKDHVVHVAIAPGKLANALVNEAGRLAGLRGFGRVSMGTDRRATAGVNIEVGATGKA